MTTEVATNRGTTPTQRYLPWLVLLFVGSGCAALVYEVVWYQMLLWAPSGIGARAQGWRGGHGLRCRGFSRVS